MRSLIAVVPLLSLTAFAAASEVTLVNEAVTQGKTRTITLSVKGAKAYLDFREENGPSRGMIRDADSKQLWLIDHDKKTVMVVTEEDSKAMEARQEQFRAQMKAQLEKMPPEQRARMEATMMAAPEAGKMPSYTYEKKKTPARKVAGFSCDDYVIKREDGTTHGEGCFASWKAIGISADDFKAMMLRAMPSTAAAGPMLQAFEAHTNAPGMPVERTMLDAQGNPTVKTTLKSLTKTALGAEKFAVPKDYTEKLMKDAMFGPKNAPPPPPAKP